MGSDEVITCASSECHVTGGVTVSSTLPQLILPLYHQDCSVISDPTLMTIARASGLAPPPCSHMYAPTHAHTHTYTRTHTHMHTHSNTYQEGEAGLVHHPEFLQQGHLLVQDARKGIREGILTT